MPPKKNKPEKWWKVKWSSPFPCECFMHKVDGDTIHVSQKEHSAATAEKLDDGFTSYHSTKEKALAHKKDVLERAIDKTLKAGGCPASYQKQLEEMEKANEQESS